MPAETAHLYLPSRATLASGVDTTDAHRMNAGQVSTVGPMISTTLAATAIAAYLGGATPTIDHAATMFLVEVASESTDGVKYTLTDRHQSLEVWDSHLQKVQTCG